MVKNRFHIFKIGSIGIDNIDNYKMHQCMTLNDVMCHAVNVRIRNAMQLII